MVVPKGKRGGLLGTVYWNLRVHYSRESNRDREREGCLQTQTAAFKESLQRCIMGGRGRLLLVKAFIDGQSSHSTGSSQLKVNTARMLLNPRSPLGGSLSQFAQGCQHLSHQWEPCSLASCWVLTEPAGLIICSKPREFLQITYTWCAKWMLEKPFLSLWNSTGLQILQWSIRTHNAEYRRCFTGRHFQTREYVHIHILRLEPTFKYKIILCFRDTLCHEGNFT